MITLKQLVEEINKNLIDYEGEQVNSPIKAYKTVYEKIKETDFYDFLRQNGVAEFLVFPTTLAEMRGIYLQVDENEPPKKIIDIDVRINYYDDSNPSEGGTVEVINCNIVEKSLAELPIQQLAYGFKYAIVLKRKEKEEKEISALREQLSEHERQLAEYEKEIKELEEKLS